MTGTTWIGIRVMIRERPLSILIHEWVTGGGPADWPLPSSWEAEGRAMRRALATDFAAAAGGTARVTVTLDARLPDDPGPWTVRRIAPGRAAHQLPELARTADFTVLVAPETTGILARLTRALQAADARLLGSLPSAVELTGDKERLCRWFESRGMETPATRRFDPSQGLPRETVFPAVLKPVDGAGSVDTFYLADESSLPVAASGMTGALLQPFVPGTPMSATFLVDIRARAWLIGIGAQDIEVRDGCIRYRGGRLPVPCRSAESQLRPIVETIPGLRGFIGVDFLWDDVRHCATVIEINPRPTTSCVGLTRLLPPGQLADAWLDAFESRWGDAALLPGLADRVHSCRPLTFDVSGAVRFDNRPFQEGDRHLEDSEPVPFLK
jgi:predicted ATP-grasp superfamily ATP-dependent carboligase